MEDWRFFNTPYYSLSTRLWILPSAPEPYQKLADELDRRHCSCPELQDLDGSLGAMPIEKGTRCFFVPLQDETLCELAFNSGGKTTIIEGVGAIGFGSGELFIKQRTVRFRGSAEDREAAQALVLRFISMMEKPETIAQASFHANVDQNAATVTEPSACPSDWMEFSQDSTHIAFIESNNATSRIQGVGNFATAARRKAFAARGLPTFLNTTLKDGTTFPVSGEDKRQIPATSDLMQIQNDCENPRYRWYSCYSLPIEPLHLVVLDVDTKNNPQAIEQLGAEIDRRAGKGAFDALMHAVQWDWTKSGGIHVWLACPPQHGFFKNDCLRVKGVELKVSGAIPLAGSTVYSKTYSVGNQGGVLSGGKIYDAILGLFEETKAPILERKKDAIASNTPLNFADSSWDKRIGGYLDKKILPNIRADFSGLKESTFHSTAHEIISNLGQFKEVLQYARFPITKQEILDACVDHENPAHEGGGKGFKEGIKDIERLWDRYYENARKVYSRTDFILKYLPERPNPNAKHVATQALVEESKPVALTNKAVAMNAGGNPTYIKIGSSSISNAELKLTIKNQLSEVGYDGDSVAMMCNADTEYQDRDNIQQAYDQATQYIYQDDIDYLYENPSTRPQYQYGENFQNGGDGWLSEEEYTQGYSGLKWIVKDLIPQSGVGFWYGDSTVGKTFSALYLAKKIAYANDNPNMEVDCFGHRVFAGSQVYYLVCEGSEGVKGRLKALRQTYEWCKASSSFKLQKGFTFSDISKQTNMNMRKNYAKAFARNIAKGSIIIVDTLSQATPDVEPNSATEMAIAMSVFTEIAREIQGVVLLIGHTGKDTDRELLGSKVQINNCDFAIKLATSKVVEEKCVKISVMKSKDSGSSSSFITFDLVHLDGIYSQDGTIESTLVVVERPDLQDAEPSKQSKSSKKNNNNIKNDRDNHLSLNSTSDSVEALAERLVEYVKDNPDSVEANAASIKTVLPSCSRDKARDVLKDIEKRGLLATKNVKASRAGKPKTVYVLPQ